MVILSQIRKHRYKESPRESIPFFVYAENATMQQVQNIEQQFEPKIQVTAPIFVFRPPFVPCLFSYSIVVGLQGFDVNSHHKVQLKLHFNNEDRAIADTGIMQIPPFPEEELTNLPDKLRGMTFTCDFRNVQFRQNGEYKTKVFFDDEILGEYPISVWGKETFAEQ